MQSIKDLIYFDYGKAKSINSQLKGGLISELSRAIEEEGGISSELGFDLKVIKGKLSGAGKEKTLRTEKIELYHELLNEIERSLEEKNTLIDLNQAFEKGNRSFNDFLVEVPNFTYIKSCGWSCFEDFDRFKRIMANFNEVQRLIFASTLENSPEVILQKQQINDLRREIKASTKPNKNVELKKLMAIEKKLDKTIEESSNAIFLEETFIERVKTFLDTFSPNRLNFRLAPFDEFNDFQILANLKSEYLVNGDFENVIYTYGSRPNIKLSILGIITSCPRENDARIDLNDEYLGYTDDELKEEEAFEKAFRDVFSSFEEFEKFFFVPRYPKVSVSPIAIYREIELG